MPLGSVALASFSGTVVFRLMNGQAKHTGTRRKPALASKIKTLAENKTVAGYNVSALVKVSARS